jgi:hypothetical protein
MDTQNMTPPHWTLVGETLEVNQITNPSPDSTSKNRYYWLIAAVFVAFVATVSVAIFYKFEYGLEQQNVINTTVSPTEPTAMTFPKLTDYNNQPKLTHYKNSKYLYELDLPGEPKILNGENRVDINYEDPINKGSILARINIYNIGIFTEPIEVTADKVFSKGFLEEIVIDGRKALVIHKDTYSQNPTKDYEEILVKNDQGLTVSIRVEANSDTNYLNTLKESVKNFKFPNNQQFVSTTSFTLSGRVTFTTGNCMPGSHSCSTKPALMNILIYPPISHKSTSEKPKLIARVKTNLFGNYKVSLSPGSYSVFVEDNGREVCPYIGTNQIECLVTLYDSDHTHNIGLSTAAY